MKVLILVHSLGRGGAQKQAGLLCKNLNILNIPCDIILVSPPPNYINKISGMTIEQPDIAKYVKFTFPYFDPAFKPLIWRKNLLKGLSSIVDNWIIRKRKKVSLRKFWTKIFSAVPSFSYDNSYCFKPM
ncbi:MAG: hypothetical protein IPI60_19765 [Saprospiraceae bacterium]|nr:hypothetical protein [Saprospiraceae bacterium]